MTDQQFNFCVQECTNYKTSAAYVSDLALSSIWGGDPEDDPPAHLMDTLRSIYTAVHRTIREIVEASGLSQAAFARRYCIPKRTVENWCSGVNDCPLYTRLLFQESLGLLQVDVK